MCRCHTSGDVCSLQMGCKITIPMQSLVKTMTRSSQTYPRLEGGTQGKLQKDKSDASKPAFSSFAPSTLPVLAAELGLPLCVSERHNETLHPAMQFQIACLQMRLSFLTHPHPAVLMRDNHSCVCKHRMLRWCLLLNISSLSTITQHPKVRFSTWVAHP